jgi:hypothetical protein
MSGAPERIYMDPDIKFPECEKRYGCDIQYVRGDLVEAAVKKLGDSLVAAEAKLSKSEALLAKAMEALKFYADGEWPQHYPGDVFYVFGGPAPEFKTHLDYGDKARTTIAELKGEK